MPYCCYIWLCKPTERCLLIFVGSTPESPCIYCRLCHSANGHTPVGRHSPRHLPDAKIPRGRPKTWFSYENFIRVKFLLNPNTETPCGKGFAFCTTLNEDEGCIDPRLAFRKIQLKCKVSTRADLDFASGAVGV